MADVSFSTKVRRAAAAVFMGATSALIVATPMTVATTAPAYAGEDCSKYKGSYEEGFCTIRNIKKLRQEGKQADSSIAASEQGLACYNNLNKTIAKEGGVSALSPARRAQLRQVRDHCDALSAGGA